MNDEIKKRFGLHDTAIHINPALGKADLQELIRLMTMVSYYDYHVAELAAVSDCFDAPLQERLLNALEGLRAADLQFSDIIEALNSQKE